eukprot:CAMPEP_0196763366 /NCGR_PEP_ID=MMETSP1095-20130614/3963_1 /TAXON_ID=96789 ORGANISM="Chromulina nebulosa, Strain UTEXLB2642" /NCGR_SAMPLE_ID=MMETSP1095 /ASSEMBLY_ACC=CAM_ASM_000446 /LENGTH=370 /DNA_ID=CAMNT_0042116413 /DNA_START=50 /DNA_END=1162 /DNA_ORIENTATION=-
MGGSVSNVSKPKIIEEDLPYVFEARYKKMDEILGRGAFSTVQSAIHRSTGKKVAVKIIARAKLLKEDELSLKREVKIMRLLKHENIISCLDFFEEEHFYFIVLEYMEGGQLFERIVTKTVFNEKEARDVVKTLVSAIKYCHDRHVIHRDIKPENLLLTSKGDDATLKVADFGFAVRARGNVLNTECGTLGYIAPEILEERNYGKAVDMWSIGVVIFIILGGYPPFYDENRRTLLRMIKRGAFEFYPQCWSNVSEAAKDLIRGLLTIDETRRLTADQVLDHPWITSDDRILENKLVNNPVHGIRRKHKSNRFKAAVKVVMAINKMRNLSTLPREPVSAVEESSLKETSKHTVRGSLTSRDMDLDQDIINMQ